MITSRSSLQTQEQTSGWKFFKIVSFENIFPSDVLETAQIRTTNCDLGEGDHHRTEFFEIVDKKDIIKMEEEEDVEHNDLRTSNSVTVGSSGKRQEKLKLR